MRLSKDERQTARKIVDMLYDVFEWSDTIEGHDYWSEVRQMLTDYGRED